MLLEARKLDKSFNGVYALKGLDLSLKEGEIHGLVGENGAGKSTFIKILGGVYTKNGGELSWNGAPFPADFGPVESRELGINIIFQDHVLIPAFSALENIWLGRPYPRKGGLIQWKEMEKAAQKKGGRTWDPFRPEEIHFPDDSGTEEMRGNSEGHDERL